MNKKKPTAEDYAAFVGMGHNSANDMSEITKLAEAQYAAQQKVDALKIDLKAAEEDLRKYSDKLLPTKMDELGIATFETSSGISVEVKEDIRVSVPPENRPKAWDWMEKGGYGALIKSTVITAFERDEIKEANALVEKLRKDNRVANLERKIEPMTLLSFVKEHLAKGKDIPLDIFKVYRQRVAKVEV